MEPQFMETAISCPGPISLVWTIADHSKEIADLFQSRSYGPAVWAPNLASSSTQYIAYTKQEPVE